MEIPYFRKIELLQRRWRDFPQLAEKISCILRDTLRLSTDEQIVRTWNVIDLQSENDFPLEIKTISKTSRLYRKRNYAYLDLGGIEANDLSNAYLHKALLQGAQLSDANLEGSDLTAAHIEGADIDNANIKKAILNFSHCEGAVLFSANLQGSKLKCANLNGTKLKFAQLEGADFSEAYLKGADIRWASLEQANFNNANVGHYNLIDDDGKVLFSGNTKFADNQFLPTWRDSMEATSIKAFLQMITDRRFWLNIEPTNEAKMDCLAKIKNSTFYQYHFNRWFYTDFEGVEIDKCDTANAGDLVRYIKDQQFLRRFHANHPTLYNVWNILTNCGWSELRVGLWSILIMLTFAWIYPAFNLIDPSYLADNAPTLPPFWKWFFHFV